MVGEQDRKLAVDLTVKVELVTQSTTIIIQQKAHGLYG